MKIRTDFVTNSSSSSFAVEIRVQDQDGKEYIGLFNPDDGGGNGLADLTCTADEVANVESVKELLDLLSDSLEIDGNPGADYRKFIKFKKSLRENITDLSQIKYIEFRKELWAWGEACDVWQSYFTANPQAKITLDTIDSIISTLNGCIDNVEDFFDYDGGVEEEPDYYYVEKYKKLGQEGIDAALNQLKLLMSNAEGFWIDGGWVTTRWPTAFMGMTSPVSFDWPDHPNDFRETVLRIARGKMDISTNRAIEAVRIEWPSKKIKNVATYLFYGDGIKNKCTIDWNSPNIISLESPDELRKNAEKRPIPSMKNLRIGSTIRFGAFLETQAGKTRPIDWIVMDRRGYDYLLVSRQVLYYRPFFKPRKAVPWDESLIREWLQSRFLNGAFNSAESSRILDTENATPFKDGTVRTSVEKVFLLSEAETRYYFRTPNDRRVDYSRFAEHAPGWGLRSYKEGGEAISAVYNGRIISSQFQGVEFTNYNSKWGVRPAMWVTMSEEEKRECKEEQRAEEVRRRENAEKQRLEEQARRDEQKKCFEQLVATLQGKYANLELKDLPRNRDDLIADNPEHADEIRAFFDEAALYYGERPKTVLSKARILTNKTEIALEESRRRGALRKAERVAGREAKELEKLEHAAEKERENAEKWSKSVEIIPVRDSRLSTKVEHIIDSLSLLYPERQVFALSSISDQLRESISDVSKKIGYASADDFLIAYRYRKITDAEVRKIRDKVIYQPGNEPQYIKSNIDSILRRLREYYPSHIIERSIQADHKSLAGDISGMSQWLGYANAGEFLKAYGYDYRVYYNKAGEQRQKAAGRPSTTNADEIVSLLKKRCGDKPYPTMDALKENNPDVAKKLKTLANKASELFGMSLTSYLKEQGILSERVRGKTQQS